MEIKSYVGKDVAFVLDVDGEKKTGAAYAKNAGLAQIKEDRQVTDMLPVWSAELKKAVGVPVVENIAYGERVEGLPKPDDGVVLIVSEDVAKAVCGRSDLYTLHEVVAEWEELIVCTGLVAHLICR